MKPRPAGVELFHADRQTDGRTDMTKLIVGFVNFANAAILLYLHVLYLLPLYYQRPLVQYIAQIYLQYITVLYRFEISHLL